MSNGWFRFGRLISLTALWCCLGCGGSDGPKLYPVTGQVLFEGQPASGATIVFHPVNPGPENYRPGGVVQADGSFKLRTYPHGDGAPPGDYIALITWFEDPPEGKEGGDNPKSRIPVRYADREKSGLTATIQAGENNLEPFRLTRSK